MPKARSAQPSLGRTVVPRNPFTRVVLATDFSRFAASALKRVALLPFETGAEVLILHVMPEALQGRQSEEREVRAQLDSLSKALRRSLARAGAEGVRVGVDIAYGMPSLRAIRAATDFGADLIVVGRRGRGMIEMLLGSTAERIARRSAIPVLLVGSNPRRKYSKPLVALEIEPALSFVTQSAARILGPGQSAADVVHAYGVAHEGYARLGGASDAQIRSLRRAAANEARDQVASGIEGFRQAGIEPKIFIRHGDARSVILEVARRRKSDIIVIGSHGRSGISHFFLGSVAEEVIRRASCDVLVARLPQVVVSPA